MSCALDKCVHYIHTAMAFDNASIEEFRSLCITHRVMQSTKSLAIQISVHAVDNIAVG
jgi:hypothetical protein